MEKARLESLLVFIDTSIKEAMQKPYDQGDSGILFWAQDGFTAIGYKEGMDIKASQA